MIVRHTEPSLHNFIGNQAGVYGCIAPDPYSGEPLDFTECADAPNEYVLLSNGSDAASIFEWFGPGIYEGHTMFLPSCRGKEALQNGRAMVDFMFEELDAVMLWGQTPTHLPAARWFNRKLGFQLVGEKVHYMMGPSQLFRMDKARWEATRR